MSTSAGASGAFGILLPERPEVAGIYAELKDHVDKFHLENPEATADDLPDLEGYKARFIAAFKENGIIIPSEALLVNTGTEDERPADCDTPAEEFVLGWGLFKAPWEYPELDHSFRDVARWHTWAWVG